MCRTPAPALVFAILATACQARSGVVSPAESGAFVVRLGNDTIAVEQYTRSGNRIEGQLLSRTPRTNIQRYAITLDNAGRPLRLEQQVRLPDGAFVPNAPRSVAVTFLADSVVAEIQRETVVTVRVPARAAHPFINTAVSLYALPIAALNAMPGADSTTIVTYTPGQPRAGSMPIARKGPNRYWLYVFGSPHEVVTDAAGRVLAVDATRSTFKIQAQRQSSVDIAALTSAFVQREQASRPGPLSPRDTVTVAVGPAQLWVDYSRPSARGRRVFGQQGVLGDTLWRTGANAATQFRTNVPIVVGGQTISAGMYTLWTVAVPGRYQLVFNKQTGQWGTVYDPAQDLARVPLQVTRLAQPVDRFTISIEPTTANAGVIRLQWGDTQLATPFTIP